MGKLSKIAEDMADGVFDTNLDALNGKYEIGILIDSFNRLKTTVDNICTSTETILSKAENGDLRTRIDEEYNGYFDQLKKSVNNIVDILVYIIQKFSDHIEEINDCASEFSKSSENISDGAVMQSNIVRELTPLLDELSSSIKHNSISAEHASNRSAEMARDVFRKKTLYDTNARSNE